jgi:hypothetical protein
MMPATNPPMTLASKVPASRSKKAVSDGGMRTMPYPMPQRKTKMNADQNQFRMGGKITPTNDNRKIRGIA